MKVTYEITDEGVHASQYWQGVGVAFTDWVEVYSGCGSTLDEAIDDALENAAQNGVDTSHMEAVFYDEDLKRPLPDDAHDEVHHYAAVWVGIELEEEA
jgi:hypothetical protein